MLPTRLNLTHLTCPDAALPDFMRRDAVARKHLALLGPLDWSQRLDRPANPVSDLPRLSPHPQRRRHRQRKILIYVLINLRFRRIRQKPPSNA